MSNEYLLYYNEKGIARENEELNANFTVRRIEAWQK